MSVSARGYSLHFSGILSAVQAQQPSLHRRSPDPHLENRKVVKNIVWTYSGWWLSHPTKKDIYQLGWWSPSHMQKYKSCSKQPTSICSPASPSFWWIFLFGGVLKVTRTVWPSDHVFKLSHGIWDFVPLFMGDLEGGLLILHGASLLHPKQLVRLSSPHDQLPSLFKTGRFLGWTYPLTGPRNFLDL